MNNWLLASALISITTAGIHIFAGQKDPVRPFLNASLPDEVKATLLGCWHMVSVILLGTGLLLFWLAISDYPASLLLVQCIAGLYLLFSLVFIGVGYYFSGKKTFVRLPQWSLLILISATSGYSTLL